MRERFYQDPGGYMRDVAVHIEPATEKRFAETEGTAVIGSQAEDRVF